MYLYHGSMVYEGQLPGIRAEWVTLDRVQLDQLLTLVVESLRATISSIRESNSSHEIMGDVERKQLIFTLECALIELAEAPQVNKSNLANISTWLKKIAINAAGRSIESSFVSNMKSFTGLLDKLLQNLIHSNFHLPWF